jgi:hypothetical protein
VWIGRHGRDGENYRFDVIGVLLKEQKVFVRHVRGAFDAAVA